MSTPSAACGLVVVATEDPVDVVAGAREGTGKGQTGPPGADETNGPHEDLLRRSNPAGVGRFSDQIS